MSGFSEMEKLGLNPGHNHSAMCQAGAFWMPHYGEQWFSTRGDFPLGGHLAMSGDGLVLTTRKGGTIVAGVETAELLNILQGSRQPPQ